MAWGAALCFVPLLNLLAFEFALFSTLPVTFIAGYRGLKLPRETDARAFGRALLRLLALTALPILPITLNALRVRNCNYVEGLLLYGLLPGLTCVIAALWGRACALAFPRFGGWAFGAVLVLSVGQALHHFFTAPPVDAFHAFVGYFPGSLYDEVIPLTGRLVAARFIDLGYALCALLLAGAPRLRRAVALAAASGLYVVAGTLDLHRDAAHVRAALGGETRSAHYIVYHPESLSARGRGLLVADLEFRYAELSAFFARVPAEPISVWFYESTEQKKRLMGAGQVRIAKPWQRAVHLQTPDLGDGILAHELAHAFSAEISDAPHHLSLTRLGLPNMGLIEGVAVAAAWDDAPLDAHQWSAAMRALEVDTPLETLLSPEGFLSVNSRAAYTQCGSFVRWLRETRGPDAVEALYRAGRLPEAESAADIAAWESFLVRQPLDPTALALAKARFDRPAIFGKVCAHEVAALRARLEQVAGSDLDAALAIVDELLVHLPGDPETLSTRLALLYRRGASEDLRDALSLARTLAGRQDIGRVRAARAREWVADLLARRGLETERPEVRSLYTELLESSFDRGWTRRIAVKLAALDAGLAGDQILAALTRPEAGGSGVGDAGDALIREAYALNPGHPISRYLMGRLQARSSARGDAISESLEAVSIGLPHPALELEALRLVAACRFDGGDYVSAAADYGALARRGDLQLEAGEVAQLETWARRARFFAAQPPPVVRQETTSN